MLLLDGILYDYWPTYVFIIYLTITIPLSHHVSLKILEDLTKYEDNSVAGLSSQVLVP